jgi:hypothetical protein
MSFIRDMFEVHVNYLSKYRSVDSFKTMQLWAIAGKLCFSHDHRFQPHSLYLTLGRIVLQHSSYQWICKYTGFQIQYLMQYEPPGHSPAKGNGLSLSITSLREIWHWLTISGLKQPSSLVWVRMHYNVRVVVDTIWLLRVYIAIVLVGYWINLWTKPNIDQGVAVFCDYHYWLGSADVQTPDVNRLQDQ